MTIIEALKAKVNYPLADNNAEVSLITRGVSNVNGQFTEEVGKSRGFELAYADMLRFICTMVNLSQGGSISLPSNQEALRTIANNIYIKYGCKEDVIGGGLGVIMDISERW